MILASNAVASEWPRFFTGDDTLPCILYRIFGKVSVFMMCGSSYPPQSIESDE